MCYIEGGGVLEEDLEVGVLVPCEQGVVVVVGGAEGGCLLHVGLPVYVQVR